MKKSHFARKIRPVELTILLKKVLRIKRKEFKHIDFYMFLDPWSNLYWNLYDPDLNKSLFEPHWTNFIINSLNEGDTFVDLGANEGWFSLYASREVGIKGKVISVEPQMRLVKVIKKNVQLNKLKNIIVVEAAIGKAKGSRMIALAPSINNGSTSFVKIRRSLFLKKQKVSFLTLTEVFEIYKLTKIDLIKIDIEGFEGEALKSGASLLQNKLIKRIIIDFHDRHLSKLGTSCSEIINFLESFGYNQRVKDGVTFFECGN